MQIISMQIKIIGLTVFFPFFISAADNRQNIELKKIRKINSECENGYFAKPIQQDALELDRNGTIYVVDSQRHQILRYQKTGITFHPLGQMGSGPGELFRPRYMVIGDERIIIRDGGNLRMQILDMEGNYISSFKLISPPINFTYVNGMLYGAGSLSRSRELDSLAIKLNMNGGIEKKFGQQLNFLGDMSPGVSHAFIRHHGNHLYLLFIYYPILRVYTMDGSLVSEFALDDEYRKMTPQNYKIRNVRIGNQLVNARFLFKGFEVNDTGFYVGLYTENLIIDHYSFECEKIVRYEYPNQHKNYFLYDFIVWPESENNTKQFVVLELPGPPERPYELNLYQAE